jgi:hypothetical protein
MRKAILVAMLCIIACLPTYAQENPHILTLSPAGLVTKLRIKYETPLAPSLTLGGTASFYHTMFKGTQLACNIRLYPGGQAPKGFYLQGKTVGGIHAVNVMNPFTSREEREASTSIGGGLGVGYQFVFSADIVIDLGIGLKFMTPLRLATDSTWHNLSYYYYGPGSLLDGIIAIGFAF